MSNWRNNKLFKVFRTYIDEHYDYQISSEEYVAFGQYCDKGEQETATPVFAPDNMYTFLTGKDFWKERKGKDIS